MLPGAGPLAVYQSDEGPATFSGIAVYGEAFGPQFSVDVAQAGAYGIAGSADGMTPEGEELLTHVPELFQETCTESPISQTGLEHRRRELRTPAVRASAGRHSI